VKTAAEHADAAADGNHPPAIENAAKSRAEFIKHSDGTTSKAKQRDRQGRAFFDNVNKVAGQSQRAGAERAAIFASIMYKKDI
jgi:hypothetical protein